jgi:serine/threonine protein kinase
VARKDVAIKSVNLTGLSPAEIVAVTSEVDLLDRCDHPNLIKLNGAFWEEEHCHLVLEYAKYGNLLELLNRQGMLSESDAAAKLKQVLQALDYLHTTQHIIHG